MLTQAESKQTRVLARDWFNLGRRAVLLSVVAVIITQVVAVAIWPDIALFEPLNSYARSALFTAVPVAFATALFAFLSSRVRQPAKVFNNIAITVLVISLIPDYLLPVANKTFLASSVTAFLHVVAGVITILVLQRGYKGFQQLTQV